MHSCVTSGRTVCASTRARLALAAIAIALAAGGCAASKSGPSYVAGPGFTFPGDLPPLPKPTIQQSKVEIEDDGLPAQLAPKVQRPMADDPSEPWSPNYGGGKPTIRAEKVATAIEPPAPIPVAKPVMPVIKASGRQMDPDDIIRQAIAEHEMRQR